MLYQMCSSIALASIIMGFFFSTTFSQNVSPLPTSRPDPDGCYAIAVYNELIKTIEIIKSRTQKDGDTLLNNHSPLPKKFQEDEDEGGGLLETDLEIPSIVPQIFQLVGSAFSLNSSGIAANSFGLLPERVSSQITNVLGSLAHTILGTTPTTTRPPQRRRRRTTTTLSPEEDSEIGTTPEGSNATTVAGDSQVIEARNATEEDTGLTTTEEVLFKESSLGETPVYAAAYAPNYIATTTFPVYASGYLHALYPAPTTTTVATTSTTTTPEETEGYAVSLPFDYQLGTTVPTTEETNTTDYDDYEYEEVTEENTNANANTNNNNNIGGKLRTFIQSTLFSTPRRLDVNLTQLVTHEDEDDEYMDIDIKTNRSLGRISR